MPKFKNTVINFIILFVFLSLIFISVLVLTRKQNNQSYTSTQNITPTEISSPKITEISWGKAQEILDSCQIVFIFQKRNLEVTMTTKDQIFYKTKQPKLNDIINKINHLPSVCTETIEKVTE